MLNTRYNNELEKQGIDAATGLQQEKVKAMTEYARALRKQFPHMKKHRIARKVAEHFHVQVVLKPPTVPSNVPEK